MRKPTTRKFSETVKARVKRDPAFCEALLIEAADMAFTASAGITTKPEYRAVPAEEVIASMSAERQARIMARAAEIITKELGQKKPSKVKRRADDQTA